MGTQTDRYTRRHRIATGGMGEVWLAHDEVLHRDVAVKYLKREYADDEGARTRFLNEARSAAALLHPGIATVFDFGESEVEDGLPFLVMEYVDGQALSALLAEGPLDPERARDLVRQAADALAVAHGTGLVHRDVKPGNLLVTSDDTVKITDFGIARAGDGLALTETGQLIGTPSYLSPEQAEGQVATSASDVYALGVVLFECLAGRRPFEADTPVAVALAHVREQVPDLPAGVPDDLAAVVHRALAKDPDERYPDAGAFAAALGSVAAEHTMLLSAPLPVVPPAVPDAAEPAAEPTSAPAAGPVDGSRTRRFAAWLPGGHERLLWGIGAALAALIVVLLVVAALGDGDATKDTPAPGSSSTGPSVSPSTPARVTVDPASYVGKPVADVRAALAELGLTSRVNTIANPGGHTAGTVAAVRPNGSVRTGATITLDVWGSVQKAGENDGPDKGGKGKGKGKHR
jgi:eukaryotic-like serine/threonine-protein kinase